MIPVMPLNYRGPQNTSQVSYPAPGRRRMAARIALALSAAVCLLTTMAACSAPVQRPRSDARLVILMVWDGLRPDSVSLKNTPNLYALAHQGVYLAHHHSMYPSLTMVNAATLATGAPPGETGILANVMYLGPLLDGAPGSATGPLARARAGPVNLENSELLRALGSSAPLKDSVVDIPSTAQQVLRNGGYVGIVGKSGPTFLFDDRVGGPAREAGDEIFISDDQFAPQSLAPELQGRINLAGLKAAFRERPPCGEQDALLTKDFIDRALPAAATALTSGRPAMLVLWQHNPDITEHAAGLGTAAFYQVLATCDANLGKLRAAIAALQLENNTDLVVLSDHGFATIKMRVALAELLVAQGLKKSVTSDDVVIAHNFGSDALYLSPHLDSATRNRLLRKIVNYAAAQEWCGPLFSRPGASADNGYLGEIPGTFSQAWFGLFNPARAPDLIISFRELPGEDNSALTGPHAPAFMLGKDGTRVEQNNSQPLVHPMPGVAYADSGAKATTGNGTHGALGEYEMHNFCAAIGPDFRRAYVDQTPTSNLDVGRTIAALLHAQPAVAARHPPFPAGRVIAEALRNGAAVEYQNTRVSATLNLPGQSIVTTIEMDRIGDEKYPGGATVNHVATDGKQPAPAGLPQWCSIRAATRNTAMK